VDTRGNLKAPISDFIQNAWAFMPLTRAGNLPNLTGDDLADNTKLASNRGKIAPKSEFGVVFIMISHVCRLRFACAQFSDRHIYDWSASISCKREYLSDRSRLASQGAGESAYSVLITCHGSNMSFRNPFTLRHTSDARRLYAGEV
jgi:hypothetical protein